MRTRLCLRGTRLRSGEVAHLLLLWTHGLGLAVYFFGLRAFTATATAPAPALAAAAATTDAAAANPKPPTLNPKP